MPGQHLLLDYFAKLDLQCSRLLLLIRANTSQKAVLQTHASWQLLSYRLDAGEISGTATVTISLVLALGTPAFSILARVALLCCHFVSICFQSKVLIVWISCRGHP